MKYTKWTPVDDALTTVVCLSSPLEIRLRFPNCQLPIFVFSLSLSLSLFLETELELNSC